MRCERASEYGRAEARGGVSAEPRAVRDPEGGGRSAGGPDRPGGLAPLDRPWTQKEAAYALGISPSEVRKLTRRGELPMLPQIGRTVRYWPETVLKFRDGWRPAAMAQRERRARLE